MKKGGQGRKHKKGDAEDRQMQPPMAKAFNHLGPWQAQSVQKKKHRNRGKRQPIGDVEGKTPSGDERPKPDSGQQQQDEWVQTGQET